jgi:hypothetical protein
MIVLDASGSMMDETSEPLVSKWGAATKAINKMVTAYPGINFGLSSFSAFLLECNPGAILVPIGPNNTDKIQEAIKRAIPLGNQTPIAGGLEKASKDPGLADATRSDGVVLITDGNENCGGDPVAQVKSLFGRPNVVRTYVIGFGDEVNAQLLANMAIQGGTARIGTPRYYQAEKKADLDEALKTISASALTCSFTLSKTGVDPSQIFVGINGQQVPRDQGHISGWDYDPATGRVTLYGLACNALATTPNAQLKINYGCAGDITEGGGDGGIDFGLDAGEIG